MDSEVLEWWVVRKGAGAFKIAPVDHWWSAWFWWAANVLKGTSTALASDW
jgi:hypothetical protein